jgi:peptidoglycan/LPS O-acetylase OafA/YrhL
VTSAVKVEYVGKSRGEWANSSPMTCNQVEAHSRPGRLVGLDFTKGTLVLMMVLYHWLNYFVDMQGFYYRYLRFLTPSFIFITGFLISQIYLPKYQGKDLRLPRRLLVRGLKLLAIFIGLNLAVILSRTSAHLETVADWSLYLEQNIGGRAAFWVLLPIAYLLIAAAAMSLISRVFAPVFTAVAIAGVAVVIVMQITSRSSALLELISIGLLGITIGAVPMHRIESLIHRPAVLGIAYGGYVCAITFWNEVYVLQIVGVGLTLAIIYAIGVAADDGIGKRLVLLLGKYSLIGYIAQIAALQVLHRMSGYATQDVSVALLCLGLGAAVTLGAVALVDCSRARVPLINKMYVAVFS